MRGNPPNPLPLWAAAQIPTKKWGKPGGGGFFFFSWRRKKLKDVKANKVESGGGKKLPPRLPRVLCLNPPTFDAQTPKKPSNTKGRKTETHVGGVKGRNTQGPDPDQGK